MKKIFLPVLLLFAALSAWAQDPSFAQFFSSPLNINPALTGNTIGDWRVISNFRDQWINARTPFATATISADAKLTQNSVNNYVDENFRVSTGGMFMFDKSMAGTMKGTYGSLNLSANLLLAQGSGNDWNGNRIRHNNKVGAVDGVEHRLGAGFGAIYGNKKVDYSNFTFGNQFNGSGFDPSVPSGENISQSVKSYISMSAGILYNFISENTSVDLGLAGFHLNKPKQTVLNDKSSVLAPRYVLHGNMETLLSDHIVLQANGIFQTQAGTKYFSVGGALGYFLSNDEDANNAILNAGLWYWSDNAIIPYLGLGYKNFQFGASYDITTSTLGTAQKRPKTFELSLIIRGMSENNGVIPSPWK